jgi:hypothetical protein
MLQALPVQLSNYSPYGIKIPCLVTRLFHMGVPVEYLRITGLGVVSSYNEKIKVIVDKN